MSQKGRLMKKIFITALLILGACVTTNVPINVPPAASPTEPIPIEPTPVVPSPQSGGGPVIVPIEPDVPSGPVIVPVDPEGTAFSDPEDLIINAQYSLIASPTGLETNDCRTLATACSLSKAATELDSGEILLLRAGIYKAGVKIVIPELDPTTRIAAYPYEHPVIDGSSSPNLDGLTVSGNNVLIQGIAFRYNVNGLVLKGNGVEVRDVQAYSNRGRGVSVSGENNLISGVEAVNNSIGINVTGGNTVVRDVRASDNISGIFASVAEGIVEYAEVVRNEVGIEVTSGTVRFNIAKDNEQSFVVGNQSLAYNNTSISAQQGFTSLTVDGQQPSIFFYNLTYEEPVPVLVYDVTTFNSWEFNITDPEFITLDETSPLFGYVLPNSPVLNVPIPEGVPVSDFRQRFGALGSY